ncbi:hypothetical protein SAMN05192558_103440 [Actinokineospora alba]|uniref:Uncharacterized protein n=1 Tax=Actinokineospora alba TaxID=504798 RepID=A0A1H0KDS7_9PSEU|nr:DUF6223 family protein [Actinokineospora alba]TDP67945.1 hypothetical protein C8E96_3503 [Actinokineospora alba]SDH89405.1 hypothetical protein SAMN05421871_102609 [Actinokineospora alba]SDO53953.1 hypothetical protein SAMN05192558_103440 [Actinokineospora alba]
MSVRQLLAAHVLGQPEVVSSYAMTGGRFWSLVGVALGLVGVVVGGVALSRRGGRKAIAALVLGLAGAVVGGLVVAAAEGGPGTGAGIVGGFVALVVGLIGAGLGWLARSRRPV